MYIECDYCHQLKSEDELVRHDAHGTLCRECDQRRELKAAMPDYDGILRWLYWDDDERVGDE